MLTLGDLHIGQDAIIRVVGGEGELRHHLLDMGLTPGTEVTLRKTAPMGDPIEVELRGYELTLRLADAQKIEIDSVHATDRAAPSEERHKVVAHPGVGELDKAASYHERKAGAPIAAGAPLTFALAGNQNCGKTTLFNQLTGSNQHVGNFPGVTVDRKDGVIRNHKEATVTDLPGIYSLSPYSNEEIVTRDFILSEHPSGIINIVDASNIERNLYLTMQLMELDTPMVLALNMMDEVRANGGTIMVNQLEEMLGIPVVPISAAKNEGIDELIEHAIHVARYRELPGRIDFCTAGSDPADPRGAVHRCIHSVAHLIEDHAAAAGLPLRFAATKLVEGDTLIEKALQLNPNETDILGHAIAEMETVTGLDREAALADMRFTFIEKLCSATVVKPGESLEHKRSVAIDKILTGKYTAIPIFIGVMLLIFYLTFHVIGQGLSDLLASGIDALTVVVDRALTAYHLNPVVQSLVIDGIFQGVGSVLSFLPIIVTLFFFLSILEDTGYMARVAFVMDKLLRRIGLSGKSIVPMLIGFGCTVSNNNSKDMLSLYQLSKSLGMEFATAAFHNSYYFHKEDNVITNKNEVCGDFKQLIEWQLKERHPKSWFRAWFNMGLINYIEGGRRMLPCEAGSANFFIDPFGDVFPCNGLEEKYWKKSMGNIHETPDFMTIWESEQAQEVRAMVRRCPKNCWMVGTASPVMHKYIKYPLKWALINKLKSLQGKDICLEPKWCDVGQDPEQGDLREKF